MKCVSVEKACERLRLHPRSFYFAKKIHTGKMKNKTELCSAHYMGQLRSLPAQARHAEDGPRPSARFSLCFFYQKLWTAG